MTQEDPEVRFEQVPLREQKVTVQDDESNAWIATEATADLEACR